MIQDLSADGAFVLLETFESIPLKLAPGECGREIQILLCQKHFFHVIADGVNVIGAVNGMKPNGLAMKSNLCGKLSAALPRVSSACTGVFFSESERRRRWSLRKRGLKYRARLSSAIR